MTLHVQVISEHFSESSAPVLYNLDQKTLNTLVALLSYSLQAAVIGNNLALEMSNSVEIKQALKSGSHEENIRNAIAPSNGSIPDSSSGVYIKRRGSISTKQAVQLVADILQTASDLMLVSTFFCISTHELMCYLHLSHYYSLSFFFSFFRSTSCSMRLRSTESARVLSPCTLHTKTRPPQSSVVAQPSSTCHPL